MEKLLKEIKDCTHCSEHLDLGPNPVVSVSEKSKILIIGQAPGLAVHKSGVPWDDKSGENLRSWMGINESIFYDPAFIGIMPMGFCYPGKGKSGDLPPRKECAPLWHDQILEKVNQVELTLLIGQYAQNAYLGDKTKKTLTETVRQYEEYLPEFIVLPHPSPRNNIWRAKNKWFDAHVLPTLKSRVKDIVDNSD